MNAQPRLLVVDDEAPLCTSAVRIFKPRGYDVDTSTSPIEGLRRATSEPYSAILLDMRMPEMDGLTFLRCLREAGSEVPVIVVTGYASVDDASAFMRMGAVDYLPKPFTPAEVSEAVSRVVQSATPTGPTPPVVEGVRSWQGQSWVQVADDGSAVVGALVDELDEVEQIDLPLPGDEVRRGLPFALVRYGDERAHVLRSPVSGVVAQARSTKARLERDEWMLRIRSWDLVADLETLSESPAPEPEQSLERPADAPRITEVIHRLVVRSREGERLALVSTGDLLRTTEGLGRALLDELRSRHLPLGINLGVWERDALEVMDDAEAYDRTLLLEPARLDRFAGTLIRTRSFTELLRATHHDTARVRSYALQSMTPGAGLTLDAATARSLARILVDEL